MYCKGQPGRNTFRPGCFTCFCLTLTFVQVVDFLRLYRLSPEIQTLAARLREAAKPAPGGVRLHLRGLVGSQDAVVAAAAANPQHAHVFVLHDKEEAAYFLADLQHLLPEGSEALLFPSSYKRPYQFDETENANVLMRAEALNRLNTVRGGAAGQGVFIVTYPEALTEKVINRQSLVKNTFRPKQATSWT